MINRRAWMLATLVLGMGCGNLDAVVGTNGSDTPTQEAASQDLNVAPSPKVYRTRRQATIQAAATAQPIIYHDGPIMRGVGATLAGGTVHMYYIWYGNWANNPAVGILTDLAQNIGASSYWKIQRTYYQPRTFWDPQRRRFITLKQSAAAAVTLGGAIGNNYSHGRTLYYDSVRDIVFGAITSGQLPLDPDGIYFVLGSEDVTAPGYCVSNCGWHYFANLNGVDVKYSFVGNAARCPAACAAQSSASPNGDIGADAMASVIAHELEETVTDPTVQAWYDVDMNENGDKCAWNFGAYYMVGNARANMRIGARDYYIQQNWLNVGAGSCALSYY